MGGNKVVLGVVKGVAVKVALKHGQPSQAFWEDVYTAIDSVVSDLVAVRHEKTSKDEYKIEIETSCIEGRFLYAFWLNQRFFYRDFW